MKIQVKCQRQKQQQTTKQNWVRVTTLKQKQMSVLLN